MPFLDGVESAPIGECCPSNSPVCTRMRRNSSSHLLGRAFLEFDAAVEVGFRCDVVADHPGRPAREKMDIGTAGPDSQAEPEAVPRIGRAAFLERGLGRPPLVQGILPYAHSHAGRQEEY